MKTLFDKFLKDESGAVTVDWVVITAAVVALGIGVLAAVQSEVNSVAGGIGDDMSNRLNGGNGATYSN